MAEIYRGFAKTLAGLDGVQVVVDAAADAVLAGARVNAAKHEKDGTFERSLGKTKAGGGLDRLVSSSDPLAAPKELGHVLMRDDEQIGYVRGQYSLRNAALLLPPII